MKRVILKEEDLEFVILEEITDNSIVGIKWRSGGKSLLTFLKNSEGASGFGGVKLKDSLENPLNWVKDSKKDYVELACKAYDAEAFVFKTHEELFNWLKE